MINQTLVISHLSAIRDDITAIKSDLREIKRSVSGVEIAIATLAKNEASHYARLAGCFDRLDDKMERIECRLKVARPWQS
jgi:hypothetical protein